MTTIKYIKHDEIPELKGLSVIKFTASWCKPCKHIAPYFEELSKEKKNISFYEVDVDKNEKLADEWNISGLPTFVFLNKKQEILRSTGSDTNVLRINIDNLLKN